MLVNFSEVSLFKWTQQRFKNRVVKIPFISESVSECSAIFPKKKVGENVTTDEVIAVMETDKLNVDLNSPYTGVIKKIMYEEGKTMNVGSDYCIIDDAISNSDIDSGKCTELVNNSDKKNNPKNIEVAENPNDYKQLSRNYNKYSQADLLRYKNCVFERIEQRVPMTKMRQIIAQRLKDSQNQSVSLSTFSEFNLQLLSDFIKQHREEVKKKYFLKLTMLPFFVKAAANHLIKYPCVNSSVIDNSIINRNYVDVSIAIATEKGLITPIVKNCNLKSVIEIQKDIIDLRNKAKNKLLKPSDLEGGTFTVSNGGVFGSLFSTPVINPPQSAILGLHRCEDRPIVKDKQISIAPTMYVALSYDHRIIDGKNAVLFLNDMKNTLEDHDFLNNQLF